MTPLENILRKNQQHFAPVIRFDGTRQKLAPLDLTEKNNELDERIYGDTAAFCSYIDGLRKRNHADYLVGGYNELRVVYGRSELFSTDKSAQYSRDQEGNQSSVGIFHGESTEPRRLHIGTDIWAEAGTPVFAFTNGTIHSFAFNDHYGDYGATLILAHEVEGISFHTLYGHISLDDIADTRVGDAVLRGQEIAHFGELHENGHWPPHLHFQVIQDMGFFEGDYPGVCRYSEREKYLANCPDPDLILQLNKSLTYP